ncbi:MAG: exonuclease SbcCD subunit D [Candidatus Zixiibacteriota bacterium]|nr:MAG: exonuclease SbcCD subunit D [candidate division Zixibacteria bacterium]
MKICHLSDSHLGAGEGHPRRGQSGLTARQEDIVNSFIEAADAIIDLKPDLCIHSGDLFHAVRPTNRIMAIAGEQLYRLASISGIPTVIIAGNHDAPKQAHLGAALEVYEHIDNLYIAAASRLKVFELGDVRIFALPHCLTVPILRSELTRCEPSKETRHNILVAHGVAAGMPEFSMADLGEQEIPLEVLDRFDYAALGHYHNHSEVAARARYAGSTERLSQSERGFAKGFLIVNLEPFRTEFRPVRAREMVSLEILDGSGKRGDQLVDLIRERVESLDSSDKIVRVRVEGISEETLKTIPADVISELKQKSFSLNITFEKDKSDEAPVLFGRSAIGRLDTGFLRFLDLVDLDGFDRERLKREALDYLAEED